MSRPRWEAEPIQIPTKPILTGSFDGSGFPFSGPHLMTGVDKLHNEGLIGTGVKIGIIDTGVDYTHPALGGCFGPGCKVAGGFDFAGDDNNSVIPGILNLFSLFDSGQTRIHLTVRVMEPMSRGFSPPTRVTPTHLSHLLELLLG